jgi:molybdenum cofactor cytidylyltransferase
LNDVAIAVLAAGRGKRLGGRIPKPMLELGGRPLVTRALDAAMGSDLRPVMLVVGYRGFAVRQLAPAGVVVVRARKWRRGITGSLWAGLEAVDHWARVGAVCIGLADQPLVGAEAYQRLAAAHRDGAHLAVATYEGNRGNPVLLDRALWREAMRLRGDVGARALMEGHPVVEVDCTSTGDPRDVDTLADLAELESRLED